MRLVVWSSILVFDLAFSEDFCFHWLSRMKLWPLFAACRPTVHLFIYFTFFCLSGAQCTWSASDIVYSAFRIVDSKIKTGFNHAFRPSSTYAFYRCRNILWFSHQLLPIAIYPNSMAYGMGSRNSICCKQYTCYYLYWHRFCILYILWSTSDITSTRGFNNRGFSWNRYFTVHSLCVVDPYLIANLAPSEK